MGMEREQVLARTFVELADTLVDDFDLVELSQTLVERCVELFDATAAGLLLADPAGDLRVLACSSDQLRIIELFEVQSEEGPCLDCYRGGLPVIIHDLAHVDGHWRRFVPVALAAGYSSVHALPVRLRHQVIGALNLFRADTGGLDSLDVLLAQAFADATAIAILQHRALHDSQLLAAQLQVALDSRVLIERAKGMLAERAQLSIAEAFVEIRSYARNHNRRLTAVCQSVLDGTLTIRQLAAATRDARQH